MIIYNICFYEIVGDDSSFKTKDKDMKMCFVCIIIYFIL